MKSHGAVVSILGAALLTSACSSAYAEKARGTRSKPAPGGAVIVTEAPVPVEQPTYKVELVDEYGSLLPTYLFKSRYYVMGMAGTRYGVKITNPTAARVEAVISIDGLDALDGEDATPGKRGYVIPAYQTITVEGFRVSMNDVAAFRFNSVGRSYAASKGKARNVGVVGVAFFREKPAPEPVAIPYPQPCDDCDDYYDYGGDKPSSSSPEGASGGGGGGGGMRRPTARGGGGSPNKAMPRPTRPADPSPSTGAPPADTKAETIRDDRWVQKERPGLGTEYGERRTAPVIRVTFERETAAPCCIVSLRYNDRTGLVALGIPLEQPVDQTEVWTRETANPFPGQEPFSKPPIGWQE